MVVSVVSLFWCLFVVLLCSWLHLDLCSKEQKNKREEVLSESADPPSPRQQTLKTEVCAHGVHPNWRAKSTEEEKHLHRSKEKTRQATREGRKGKNQTKERKEKERRGSYRTRSQQRRWIARNSDSYWPSRHLGSTRTPNRSNLGEPCKALCCRRNRAQKLSDSRSRARVSHTRRLQQRSLHKKELPETDNESTIRLPPRGREDTGHHLKELRCLVRKWLTCAEEREKGATLTVGTEATVTEEREQEREKQTSRPGQLLKKEPLSH